MMDKMVSARKRKEHELWASVSKIDDELNEKMVAFVRRMHNHLNDMERRWTDKFCQQGSGAVDAVVSTAEHWIEKNVMDKVSELWNDRMDMEDKINTNRYEPLNTAVQ